MQPVTVQCSQKHTPVGIHCMQASAAVVVCATISGVVIVPVYPVTGCSSTNTRNTASRRTTFMAAVRFARPDSAQGQRSDR